jgi:hypothetical protein
MSLYSPYFIIKSLQEALFRKYSGYLAGRVLDVGCGGKPCKDSLVSATGYVGLDLVAAGAVQRDAAGGKGQRAGGGAVIIHVHGGIARKRGGA